MYQPWALAKCCRCSRTCTRTPCADQATHLVGWWRDTHQPVLSMSECHGSSSANLPAMVHARHTVGSWGQCRYATDIACGAPRGSSSPGTSADSLTAAYRVLATGFHERLIMSHIPLQVCNMSVQVCEQSPVSIPRPLRFNSRHVTPPGRSQIVHSSLMLAAPSSHTAFQ